MPYKINYHFSNKCGSSCPYCYTMTHDTLDSDVIQTFDSITKLTNTIDIIGYEVFSDIEKLYDMINLGLKRKIQMSITTQKLILSENFDNPKIHFILKHIHRLSINIDSFDETSNIHVGKKYLETEALKNVSKFCKMYHTKLNIFTIVSRVNVNERLVDLIENISPDAWKISVGASNNLNNNLSENEFDEFVYNNASTLLDISLERSSSLSKSYIMINPIGNIFIDQTIIDSVNITSLEIEEGKSKQLVFETILMSNGFDENAYLKRYMNNDNNISVDVKLLRRKLGKRFYGKENMLLIDVEGINPRIYETKKIPFLTLGFKPVLYTGLIVNSDMAIINTISDYLNPNNNIIRSMYKNDKKVFETFYTNIVKIIIENQIGIMVVSGIDSELSFFEELLYYAHMNRIEFEYIKTLMNNLIDVQSIKKEKILHIDTPKFASRNILKNLNEHRSDIFPFTRSYEKDESSSRYISINLLNLYINPHKYTKSEIDTEINYNLKYCLDDVYDDYKLIYAYLSMARFSPYCKDLGLPNINS